MRRSSTWPARNTGPSRKGLRAARTIADHAMLALAEPADTGGALAWLPAFIRRLFVRATPAPEPLSWYEEYLQRCVCVGCGAKFTDRPRDAQGVCQDRWMTEEQCMACYERDGYMERVQLADPIMEMAESLRCEVHRLERPETGPPTGGERSRRP